MIVSVTDFDTYSGNMETSTEVVALKTTILTASQQVVEEYLGFSIESSERTDTVSGIGQSKLYLYALPITTVSSILLSGQEVSASEYSIGDRYLRLNSGVWPVGIDNVEVEYTAGWSASTLPAIIKMTILQIASLMLQETEGNIGITGKSFSENSRTFINYTNFDKWLKKLDVYRVVRLV